MSAIDSRANSREGTVRRPTAEQLERIAQAYYAAAQDRSVPAAKRLSFRIEAMRGRSLAQWVRKRGSEKANGTTKA